MTEQSTRRAASAPARSSPPGQAGGSRLRRMEPGDLAVVLTIERRLFPEDAWSERTMRAELSGQPGSKHYVVAERGGRVVGYAGLSAAGVEGAVQTIAVLPEYQGRGVGAALLRELLAEAGRRRCAEVFLEVRADNPRARALYEWFGFEVVGTRPGYYQPSGTDALVMRRRYPAPRSGVSSGGL